jgi:hypothetical protein
MAPFDEAIFDEAIFDVAVAPAPVARPSASVGGGSEGGRAAHVTGPKVELYPLSKQKAFRPRNLTGNRWIRPLGKGPFKGL